MTATYQPHAKLSNNPSKIRHQLNSLNPGKIIASDGRTACRPGMIAAPSTNNTNKDTNKTLRPKPSPTISTACRSADERTVLSASVNFFATVSTTRLLLLSLLSSRRAFCLAANWLASRTVRIISQPRTPTGVVSSREFERVPAVNLAT